MSKYTPLRAHLRSQPDERSELVLSFGEIEQILRVVLPATARSQRPWWANTESHSHAASWLQEGWRIERVNFAGEQAVFRRSNGKSNRMQRDAKIYTRLKLFFESLPPPQRQVVLTFSELGSLIGQTLPEAPLRYRSWWANTASSPQGGAWTEGGWSLQKVYLPPKLAVFRKVSEDPLKAIPRYVKELLEGSPRSRPDIQTLSGWLRICRQVGWYFEGTILFERVVSFMESADDLQRAEVDEDYDVCRRELMRYKDAIRRAQMATMENT